VTKDFDWDSEVSNLLFQVTAKFGIPYFQNCIKGGIDPRMVRAMCCRLQLDLRELHRRYGGFFGFADKTGSVGVVTINMPRLGYLSRDEGKFFERLERLMELAKDSLEIKRKLVEENMKRGLLPFSARYLGTLKFHFSTIGLIGMHEACLNFLGEGIETKAGKEFAIRVLKFMRERLVEFQDETGNVYNLEATPAEGTSHRLARLDKKCYPKIITASKRVPYYTNCISEDTEILTNKGWRKIDEIKSDEMALTYNVNKQILEYKPILSIYKYPAENRRMIRIKHKKVDLLVTPNHFVLYSPKGAPHKDVFTLASNLNSIFSITVAANYNKKDNPRCSDDFLKLLGWIISEGHFAKDCAGIRIYQAKNSPHVSEIKNCLEKLNLKYNTNISNAVGFNRKTTEITFLISAESGHKIRRIVGEKRIPRKLLDSLSPRQLETLLKTIVKGDGTEYKNFYVIYTADSTLADQLMELGIKIGRYASLHDYRKQTGVFRVIISKIKRRHRKYEIRKDKHVSEETYAGRVWCIETENKTIVVRRKVGNSYKFCVTGNSTHLPVGYTNNLIEALRHQDDLQVLYNGGTILHGFLGEAVSSAEGCKVLVRKIAENFRLPYYTITPTFSICMEHGYLRGEHFKCPRCGKPAEVYSRIVGYFRPVANWNQGKQEEFKDRLEYDEQISMKEI